MIPFEKNRSYRRFYQNVEIAESDLKKMVDAARLSPSSRNVQPIKFFMCNDKSFNARIFPLLGWAGYLKEWSGPEDGERPSGYIILLHDKNISAGYSCDNGIFAQSILLQAVDLGYGGCMIATYDKPQLSQLLKLPEYLEPILVIAIGKPKEIVVIDDVNNGDIKYFRDEQQVHHVPKRSLEELIYRMDS